MSAQGAQADTIECEQTDAEDLSEYEKGRSASIRRNEALGIKPLVALEKQQKNKSKAPTEILSISLNFQLKIYLIQ